MGNHTIPRRTAFLLAGLLLPAFAHAQTDKAGLAIMGARMTDQAVWLANSYCQMAAPVPMPPSLVDGYTAKARQSFSDDADFDTDLAEGQQDHSAQIVYDAAKQADPAAAEQSRQDTSKELIATFTKRVKG